MTSLLNVRRIVEHVNGMGDFVAADDRDALAQAVYILSEEHTPETVEIRLMETSRASAIIGYLEAKWHSIERRAKADLASRRADAAKAFRQSVDKKTTEAQVNESVDLNPAVQASTAIFNSAMEMADIFQALRYAIKNMIDGLLELSRNERVDRRTS